MIEPAQLLNNDSDPDGDALSITSVGNATNGAVSLQPSGEVLFTPTAGYSGAASFTYTIADPSGATATATVSLAVDAGTCTCQIVGTNGNDVLDGTNQSDGICGLDGDDLISGGNSNDCLDGNDGNDTLSGGNGKDDLRGGAGDDQICGDNGVDRIIGEGGNDILTGGLGPDTFVFAGNFGNDVITDFTPGRGAVDVLEIDGAHGLNLAAVLAVSQQVAGGTLIDLNPLGLQGTIMLKDVNKSELIADDFRFV
jgi:Ca2+-binding RTX toxin-like protein